MGSSCSTLPRLCPACKTRTWHCMPGSNCCLEVLCTSRNLVYPENSLGSSCRTVPRLCPRRKKALGIVCLAANWWSRLLNTQGLSLRRQDNHAEEEPHEEVLFGFPIGGCFHPSAGVTD